MFWTPTHGLPGLLLPRDCPLLPPVPSDSPALPVYETTLYVLPQRKLKRSVGREETRESEGRRREG
jgi:hypothetical protein